jgi:thioesterase domain-containing protein
MTQDRNALLWRLVSKRTGCIVALGGDGERAPFYCVHSIGGEVGSLLPRANALGDERRVYGIQVPRERLGAEFASSVAAMADYYVDILTAFQPEGPFLLGGWSTGSVIALEMAQKFRQRGRNAEALIVLDGILYNTGAGISRRNPLYYWKLAANLPRWIAGNLLEGWGPVGIAKRVGRELKLLTALVGVGRRSIPPGSSVDAFIDTSGWPPEQAAFARAMCCAQESYCPEPYDGRVLLFTSKTQPLLHLLQVETTWRKVAAHLEAEHIDGTHLSMVRMPRVIYLANRIREMLAMPLQQSPVAGESHSRAACHAPDGSLAAVPD